MRLIAFDLDDTLYKEIDFLHSGYREIARRLSAKYALPYDRMYGMMLHPENNAFDDLNDYLKTSGRNVTEDVTWMIETYRTHRPDITLDHDTERVLAALAADSNNRLALITDGRVVTQTTKIEALGLLRFISPENISISEAIGKKKTSRVPFSRIMALNPDCTGLFYIGDNPVKDFYWGNLLGWTTVQINDDGRNIQRQNVVIPRQYHAQTSINTITSLPEIIRQTPPPPHRAKL